MSEPSKQAEEAGGMAGHPSQGGRGMLGVQEDQTVTEVKVRPHPRTPPQA